VFCPGVLDDAAGAAKVSWAKKTQLTRMPLTMMSGRKAGHKKARFFEGPQDLLFGGGTEKLFRRSAEEDANVIPFTYSLKMLIKREEGEGKEMSDRSMPFSIHLFLHCTISQEFEAPNIAESGNGEERDPLTNRECYQKV